MLLMALMKGATRDHKSVTGGDGCCVKKPPGLVLGRLDWGRQVGTGAVVADAV